MADNETKYWIHSEGWLYQGDQLEGARAATKGEISEHMKSVEEAAEKSASSI